MTRFTLMINDSPYGSQGSYSALCFAKSVLKKGHDLSKIFFYFDGAYHYLLEKNTHDENAPLARAWHEFIRESPVELTLCTTAAKLRGINAETSQGLHMGSLTQWVEAMIDCDRFIVFGG